MSHTPKPEQHNQRKRAGRGAGVQGLPQASLTPVSSKLRSRFPQPVDQAPKRHTGFAQADSGTVEQWATGPQYFVLAQCECPSVPSCSLYLESKFCSFQSPQTPLARHTTHVTSSRVLSSMGTTSPHDEAGGSQNRFQTLCSGQHTVGAERSPRSSGSVRTQRRRERSR